MTEHFPTDPVSLAYVRERIGDRKTFGTITVAYDSDSPETGQVWVRAVCSECDAQQLRRVISPMGCAALARDVAQTVCVGHDVQPTLDRIDNFITLYNLTADPSV